jgi:hypothetical protein
VFSTWRCSHAVYQSRARGLIASRACPGRASTSKRRSPPSTTTFVPSPAVAERREWTRLWWTDAAGRYELVTSPAVFAELEEGESRFVPLSVGLLADLPVLSLNPQVAEIVQQYIRHKPMPAKTQWRCTASGACFIYECDFIVAWNCRHLANPNKLARIQRINGTLGLAVPEIVTPLDLLRKPG